MRKFISWLTKSFLSNEFPDEQREISKKNDFLYAKILEGRELKKENKFTQAIICYLEVLNIDFNCYEAHKNLAEIYTQQGKSQQAKFHIERAIDLENKSVNNNNLSLDSDFTDKMDVKLSFPTPIKDTVLSKKYDIDKSNKLYSNYSTSTVFSLSESKVLEKETFKTSQIAEQSHEKTIFLPDENYLLSKKYLQARNEKTGKILLEQALLFYEDRQWTKAIAVCQKVLQKSPSLAEAHKIWGNCLQQQGKTSESIERYAKALEVNPDFFEAYTNMGSIFAKRGQKNKALDYYTQALHINPRSAAVHRNLARLWEELNDFDKAEEHLFHAIDLEPETLSAEQHLQLAEELIKEGKKARAISCCHHAIELEPKFQEAYTQLIDILEASERWRETSQYYRQLLKLKDEVIKGKIEPSKRIQKLLSSSREKRSPVGSKNSSTSLVSDKSKSSVLLQLPQSSQVSSKSRSSKIQSIKADSVEAKLKIGDKYALEKHWKEAIYCYKQVIEQKPNCAVAYYKLADVYRQTNDTESFVICTYRFYVLKPESATAKNHFVLGNLLINRNKIIEAAVCFRKALELEPTFTQAQDKLDEITAIYQQRQIKSNKLEENNNAESANPTITTTIQSSNVDETLNEIKRLNKIKPKFAQESAENLAKKDNSTLSLIAQSKNFYELGVDAESEKDWQLAVACYQKAIFIEPNNWKCYYSLGDVLSKQKSWQKAIDAYSQSIEINSEYFWAYHNLGEAYLELEQWQDAVEPFEQAIRLNSEFSWSYYKLGTALMRLNQMVEAAENFRLSINLKPDFDWVHHKLGDILVTLKDWDGAISAYRKAIEITPDLPETKEKLSDVLRKRSQLDRDQVEDYYKSAIEQEPERESLYYKSLELNPNDVLGYINLAKINVDRGNQDIAIAFYKIALQIEPNNQEAITALQKLKSQLN